MASYPDRAVKKFTKPAHREIAVGILIAYGLFPRTNDGIAQAEKLIAGRETWLAPSDLPNYYDNIESDLMTGNETAGIVNIRMILKEFYGLTDTKTSKSKVITGKTTVYKPEDKFVDDVQEKLDQKLEEKSNEIMDVVDALIEKQKKDFEDFKKKQQEQLEAKRRGENQYPTPIGPDPMQGPVEPPVQGPKAPPKKTVAPEKDEDWESEVPDQLGTKLDELIEQVKNDPLPQPTGNKRRKTKGKGKVGNKLKFNPREMGLGGSLNEILENVIETRETLFNLYKLNKERFEFKKDVDERLTQLLQGKVRESQLEKPVSEEKDKDGKKQKEEERKPSEIEKGLINGLVVTLGSMLVPLIIEGIRPLFGPKREEETDEEKAKNEADIAEEKAKEEESKGLEEPAEPEPAPQQPPEAIAPEPTPQQPPAPLPDTSSPGDYDYREPSLSPSQAIPMRAAAKGGKFKKGKQEKLKPVSGADLKETKVDKLTKVIPDIISLPQKAAAVGMITLANSVISPFSPFIPKEGKDFINNIYREASDMAGLKGFDIRLKEEESIFDKLKKVFDDIFGNMFGGGGAPDGTGAGGPPGGAGTSATASEEDLLKRLMIAEAGGEGELGMAAVARSVINRAGLVQSGKLNASQFNAASGSVSDIIKAPGQFSPYAQGKLERQLSPEENARATKALEIARNQADLRGRLEAMGYDASVINTIMAATGFRNYAAGARIDRSQQVNEQQLGRHTFNTAGNAGMLYMPYMGATPPSPPPTPPASGKDQPPPPGPTPRPDRRASAAAAARARGQSQESTPEVKPPSTTESVSSPAPKQPSP